METAQPRPTRARPGRASDRDREAESRRDTLAPRDEYDLLTALLMGVAVGSMVTLLFRRGPSGRRPAAAAMRVAGTGAAVAGRYGARGARWARQHAERGAEWMGERGQELADRVPDMEDVVDEVRDYLSYAREAINDTVSDELKDLRKAIRRQRKRIGI
ncbi:MAG TPA: hypothetical protein VFS44_10680 [Gemmatimonadaceae bacterium]|nr:hypothetical protein [Gemmatimonadaceae bacterium]